MGHGGGVRPPLLAAALAGLTALLALAPAARASTPALVAPSALPLAGRTIAIDPGHQLTETAHPQAINRKVWVGFWKVCNTSGTATNGGYPEATFTWATSLALKADLEVLGARVRLTRSSNSHLDPSPCIDARGRFGAKVGADLEISLHGDGAASQVHGFFVIKPGLRRGYTDDILRTSNALALSVRSGLSGAGFPVSSSYGGDGLDVRRDLGTLNMADVPTVMVELGNMRNAGDARCMTSPRCRGRYAQGLADGVRSYLARPAQPNRLAGSTTTKGS